MTDWIYAVQAVVRGLEEELGIVVQQHLVEGPLAECHKRELHIANVVHDVEFVECYRQVILLKVKRSLNLQYGVLFKAARKTIFTHTSGLRVVVSKFGIDTIYWTYFAHLIC